MRRWGRPRVDWVGALVALVALALVALVVTMVVAVVQDRRAQRRCEDLGGRVEEYDCQTTYVTTSCGSDCEVSTPVVHCEWRCVGAPAEAMKTDD